MIDREKVIKGVHDARRYLEDREWVDKSVGVHIDALNDALVLLKEQATVEHALEVLRQAGLTETLDVPFPAELLKEQEAVEPDVDSERTCTCGNCGENVGYYPAGSKVPEKLCKYCPECGKAVKWNDKNVL